MSSRFQKGNGNFGNMIRNFNFIDYAYSPFNKFINKSSCENIIVDSTKLFIHNYVHVICVSNYPRQFLDTENGTKYK